MLTQVEVFTSGVPLPPLPIVDQSASLDLIQVKNIDGLGPVKATINTTQYGSVDGEVFNGSYTPKRNIVLTLKLNPDWDNYSFESLRQILYSYFMPENEVRLRFTSTHMAPVEIKGYVESFDPDLFVKDPDGYQVSIICPKPYFIAVNSTVVPGVTSAFADATQTVLHYEADVPTGFIIDFTATDAVPLLSQGEVRIINNTPTLKTAIFTPITISDTQLLRVSSVQGDKFVRQYPLPSGSFTDVLKTMAAPSSWITLKKGDNFLQISSLVPGLAYTLTYYARYGGL